MTKNKMWCFVLLHYNSIEDTIRCVESIQKSFADNNYKIVIVDNASPNKTGNTLKEHYSRVEDIVVLLCESNMGFAKGNNLGYAYCKDNFNPDFIIIANSDVEFIQKEFLSIVENKYTEYHFSVFGPDIINTTDNIHQNPLRLYGMPINEIKNSIRLRKFIVCANKRYGICYGLLKMYKFLKGFINKESSSVLTNKQGFNKEIKNCVLYGACFIFSPIFISKHSQAFFPETFMYFEEEFLWYMLINNGEETLYSPLASVLHKVNGATNYSHADQRERLVFKESNAIDSAKKLIFYIESGSPKIW